MVLPLIPIALSLASEFAPTIIRHLVGDKAGDVAQTVVDAAQQITGKGSPEEAVAELRANPELVLQFKQHMADIEVKIETAYLEDRQDARARDVALRRLGDKNYRANIMLAMAFFCLLAICWAIYDSRLDIPDGILAIFNMAVGMILKMIGDAFQFEFGSSRGSKEKDLSIRQGQ